MTMNRKQRRKQRAMDRTVARAGSYVPAPKPRPADTRIVYGIRCVWWDGIDKVALSPPGESGHRIPCCPHCGSPLFEMEDEEIWFAGVDRHQANGHPGYRRFVEWLRGKCFPNAKAAMAAYASETGEVIV